MKKDYIIPQTQIVRLGNNNLLGISITNCGGGTDKTDSSVPDADCNPETSEGGETFGDAKKGSTGHSIWDNWDE